MAALQAAIKDYLAKQGESYPEIGLIP